MTWNMVKTVLWTVVVLQLTARCAGQNPCQGMTVGDCELGEDNIINTYPVEAKACQSLCEKSDSCKFWRDYKNETGNLECLHLNTNYHKDCRSFAGSSAASIQDCLDVDLTTCGAIIGEECQYTGVRQEDFEPPAGDISSIGECQAWARDLVEVGIDVGHFHFYFPTEECRLYASLEASCDAVGGPSQAPPVGDCQEWTVIQRRGQFGDPEDYFSSKLWVDYVEGFGDPEKEVWLGLRSISSLTREGNWQLRVDLVDFQGNNYTALYNNFRLEEGGPYRIQVSGFDQQQSNIQDSLAYSNGAAFSTSDNDNDSCDCNCAAQYLGAWWYKGCHDSNLNGYNYNRSDLPETPEFYAKGIIWNNGENVLDQDHYFSWPAVEMKIRRTL